mmetsp:Transcript_11352/g.23703  ORF Transcript_11352/g.23703 Transcript_11352/m.23703 type:complete len:222 (-) Transcript_11352:340-1005(-)
MVFRSQLIFMLHMILAGSGVKVVNRWMDVDREDERWQNVWRSLGGQAMSSLGAPGGLVTALRDARDGGATHVLPLYKSSNVHWRVVLVDPRSRGVYLFDPLGAPSTAAEREAMSKAYEGYEMEDLGIRVQNDGYNCGVYVAWLARVWLAVGAAPTPRDQAERMRDAMRGAGDYQEKARQLRREFRGVLLGPGGIPDDILDELEDNFVLRAMEAVVGPAMGG